VVSAVTLSEAVLSDVVKASSKVFLFDVSVTVMAEVYPLSQAASPTQVLTMVSHDLVYAASAAVFLVASVSLSLVALVADRAASAMA